MQFFVEILFWVAAFLIFYTYVGYGLIVWLWVKSRNLWYHKIPTPTTASTHDSWPTVTVVVPAYNEQACIAQKWHNTLALNYPKQCIQLLFVTEGSTDGTTEVIAELAKDHSYVRVIGGVQRKGKVEAINEAMTHITTDIVVFTDANTLLNPDAIALMIRHFADPQVGAVAGEKRIQTNPNEAAAGAGEGLYWQYESFLKRLDTQLHSVVGAAGELFAVRRACFQPVEADTLLDDFVISLRIAEAGYRVAYEPAAYALERPSFSVQEEKKRKIRIAAGGFQALVRLSSLLRFDRTPILSFQYISHRAMRWAVAPFCLIVLLISNFLLSLYPNPQWYDVILVLQMGFYVLAAIGYWLENHQIKLKPFFVPFYFTFMNVCALLGFWRYRRGIQSGIWEKSQRAA